MTPRDQQLRQERIARTVGTALLIVALAVGVLAYYVYWIDRQLFDIGAANVEETNAEIAQLFNEIAESRWNHLSLLSQYIENESFNHEDHLDLVATSRNEVGFTYYYLLNDDGRYRSDTGEIGTFDFTERRSTILTEYDQSLLDATLPSGEHIVLFVCRVQPNVCDGFEYTAIAYGYNEKDIGDLLKVNAYNGATFPYIMTTKGRAVITSDRTTEKSRVEDLADYLPGVDVVGMSAEELMTSFRNRETATAIIDAPAGEFYVSYQPLEIQDYMLVSFTLTSGVNGSIDIVRTNTITMIAVVSILILILTAYGLWTFYSRDIRRKRAELAQKDAQLVSKDEQIETKDARISEQESRLEAQNKELEERNATLESALAVAEAANQAKTAFLSNVSHDIRTPLNAIIGFTTLAEHETEPGDEVRDYLDKIRNSSHHLLNLINDVLDYSKIEAGRVSLNTSEVNMHDLLEGLSSILRPQVLSKNLTVDYDWFTGIPCIVEADELRVTQILVNVLSNAIKYTPSGGTIRFRVANEIRNGVARYTFTIGDTGIGISKEYLTAIWDPFSREEKSVTNKVQGTGLGLSITKNLVDLMGGTIDVQSEKNVGTTFTIRIAFRLVRLLEEQTEPAEAAPEEAGIDGLHVLIAEDNELNSEILTELLDLEGCSAVVTENGRLCVEEFERQPEGTYDAILMDVQMPEMNGYEATRAIRALERPDAQTIPIIAVTANAFLEDKRDAQEAGMNAHVMKPIDMQVLKQTMNEVLHRSFNIQ